MPPTSAWQARRGGYFFDTLARETSPRGARVARGIAISQCWVTALFALGFGLAQGSHAGVSAGLGGLINTLATLYLAHRVFSDETSPRAILRNLIVGEFVKTVLTVALFVLVLLALEVAYMPLLVTYAATFVAFWIALLRSVDL